MLKNNIFDLAAKQGYKWLVLALLSIESCKINLKDKNGQNALMKAASLGHYHICLKLLTRNPELKDSCRVNMEDDYGKTALMLAATKNHRKIIDLLINHGAS